MNNFITAFIEHAVLLPTGVGGFEVGEERKRERETERVKVRGRERERERKRAGEKDLTCVFYNNWS